MFLCFKLETIVSYWEEYCESELTIVSSLKHKNTQPLYIFNRVRVLHIDRLKEGTWLHSFAPAVYHQYSKTLFFPSLCMYFHFQQPNLLLFFQLDLNRKSFGRKKLLTLNIGFLFFSKGGNWPTFSLSDSTQNVWILLGMTILFSFLIFSSYAKHNMILTFQ